MAWALIGLIVIGYIVWKFNSDSKRAQLRNLSLGGMKSLFPDFVEYFENNSMELVEDSGTRLVYKKALTDNPPFNKYLYLGIESKFTNIAFGYVINGAGEKSDGLNVEFYKNTRPEEIDMIIRKVVGDLYLKGIL
jgi:hypothetical protein